MKKNIKYALLLVLAVLGMASCSSDEFQYEAPKAETGAQVYFPTTNPTKVTVVDENGSVSINLSRAVAGTEAQVALNAKSSAGKVKAPASVVFGADDKQTEIKLDYTGLEFDEIDTVTIAIDSVLATSYGMSSTSVIISRPAPWKTIGKATYVDDLVTALFGVANVPYLVTIQENELYPGFYRLVNPYGKAYPYNAEGDYDAENDYYMYIHAENPEKVYVETFYSGMDWGYGEFFFGSIAGLRIEQGVPEKAEGYYGTLKNGEITFPVSSMLMGMADYQDGGLFKANGSGAWSVLLPGYVKADYTVSATASGIFTDLQGVTSVVANVEAGPDVESVKAIVMPADVDAAAVADAIAAGELEAMDAAPGRIEIPFDAEEMAANNLQVIVVVVVDGEVKSVATSKFEYYGGGQKSPWKSLGVGLYTDDVVIPMFDASETEAMPPITYEVEIQENTENPGYYRLVDPYGPNVYPYYDALASMGCKMPKAGNYLYINATDPEGVYIDHQSLLMDIGEGEVGFITEAARYLSKYDLEVVKNAGFTGWVKDGVISFPSFAIPNEDGSDSEYVYQGLMTVNGQLQYYVGLNEAVQIVLPEAVTSSAKKQAKATQKKNPTKLGKSKTASKYVACRIIKTNGLTRIK